MHRLAGHPVSLRDFHDRDAGQDFQHGPVPLLDHVQLPKHDRRGLQASLTVLSRPGERAPNHGLLAGRDAVGESAADTLLDGIYKIHE
jgi:hypothetical protein